MFQNLNFKENGIALLSIIGIAAHLFSHSNLPLYAVFLFGGLPLVYDLSKKVFEKEFGSDLLAGVSIVTAILLKEYLAGSIVVLMLSGGKSLEKYAMAHASSVLEALAKRLPNIAHRKGPAKITDINAAQIAVGDCLIIFPHEVCPVDGVVTEGQGVMDESYLTGEPFEIAKAPGSTVLSGAVNGTTPLTIEATKLPADSRFAKIMEVFRLAEENRPKIRRLGDVLGAYYTPLAVGLALGVWFVSHSPIRFLSVLVIATPCPLLLAIPIAIIGSFSLAAKRGILIRNPSALEQIGACKTAIFDKTGTLTYGTPHLSEEMIADGFDPKSVLKLIASLEQYSKHPLAQAILEKAKEVHLPLLQANSMSETPGQGLQGIVEGKKILITNRKGFCLLHPEGLSLLPLVSQGLECVVLIDGHYAALYRFRDAPRKESRLFVQHLTAKHPFKKIMLVSGDRESEVHYLADQVGIREIHASKSPEEKVAIVREEMKKAKTLFVGDGINDAPALMTATVGIAMGHASDVTSQAAGAIIMNCSLAKVDEFFHIGKRMRRIALQSAVGGMALSFVGMIVAAFGFLPPVAGAVTQEIIDVIAILNALRVAIPPKKLIDF